MTRRSLLFSLLPVPGTTDKDRLMQMFDKSAINFSEPDDIPNAVSIKVDGDTVIGIDGYTAVFVFTHGKLSKIELWGTKTANQETL